MRVKSTDLQNAFGKYLALVEKEDIIVIKNGKSVAKLIKHTDADHFLVQEEGKSYDSARRISYEEYMDMVNSSDQRFELIDGVVYLLASPTFRHQVVVNEIAWHFHNFFKGKRCRPLTAPLDIKLFGRATKFEENPNVVQPDVFVVCDEDKVTEASKYEGVPTLIVEVLSPTTRGKDMALKLNLYMKSGVEEYWLVDPERNRIQQYSFINQEPVSTETYTEGSTIESTAFSGLAIQVSEIFA